MNESLWNKDGFLFEFNYAYTGDDPMLIHTTRCRLFWRTLLWSPLIWTVIFFAAVLVFLVLFPIAFLVGARPAICKGDVSSEGFVSYKKWPTVKGHRILPAGVAAVALLVYLLYLVFIFIASKFSVVQIYLVITVLALLSIWAIVQFSRTEMASLFWQHLTEKKRDWCPNVRFVSKEELLAAKKEKN